MNKSEYISYLFIEITYMNTKLDSMGKSLKKNLLIQKRNKKMQILRKMTDTNFIKKEYYQEEKLL